MPYLWNGRHPEVDVYFDPSRGINMSDTNQINLEEELMNTKLAMDKDEDLEIKEHTTKEMTKTKEFLKSIVSKRKLRLDIEAARAHSAPTSPASNVSVLELTWDEEELRSIKRSKQDYNVEEDEADHRSGEKRLATKIYGIIKSIDKEVKAISVWAKERNTKKELKEGIHKLRSLVSQIETQEAQALLQTLGSGARPREGSPKFFDAGTSHDLNEEAKRREEKLADLERANALLAQENAKLKEEIKQLQNTGKTILEEDMLRDTEDYKEFLQVEKLVWPRGIYKSAFLAAGSPRTPSKDADILVLHEEGRKKYNNEVNEELEGFFQERHPELKEIDGKVGAITISTKVIKPGETTCGSDKWVIRAELDLDEGGKEWFDTLVAIKRMMVDGGRKKLSLYPPSPDTEGNITRKALEYIFRTSGIKCLVHVKPQAGDKIRKTVRRSTDALVLSQSGKSYSDLLKTLKTTVKPNTTPARAIRTIRESKNGGMVVVLDKDTKAVEELRSELNKINDVKVRTMKANNDTMLFINDIDGLTNKDDITQSIRGELSITDDCISVGDLRKSYGGNQTTMVRLPHDKAEQLLAKGRIRIGLSWYPVREKVQVTRCFRCWKYGHLARDCKEKEDDSQLCRKCGGSGHEARGSDRGDFCLTCKTDGHTAGSGACPEFRKAIARERLKKKTGT